MTTLSKARRSLARAAAVALLASAFPLAARAQLATPIHGSWVRFTPADSTATSRFYGRIISITRVSVTVEAGPAWKFRQQGLEAPTVTYPMSAISGMEVRTETHGHAVAGLAVGLLSGVAAGALIASASGPPSASVGSSPNSDCGLGGFCLNTSGFSVFSESDQRHLGMILGGMLGALVGAGIGSGIQREVWVPADSKTAVRLQITPRSNGLGAGLSFSLP